MPFSIVRDELARQRADVVVLPANPSLVIDGGAGLAVGRVAGLEELQRACNEIGGCAVGHAVVTSAFAFPARALVHAVGPIWDGTDEVWNELRATYDAALLAAANASAASVALPLISAGSRGCPAGLSLHIALEAVKDFLVAHDEIEIAIVLFSDQATHAGKVRFPGLAQYIDGAYVEEHEERYDPSRGRETTSFQAGYSNAMSAPLATRASEAPNASMAPARTPSPEPASVYAPGSAAPPLASQPKRKRKKLFSRKSRAESVPSYESESIAVSESAICGAPSAPTLGSAPAPNLHDVLDSVDAPFSTTLLAIIDSRGMTDAEVYRRANLSRQHFSKIRSNPNYQPTKKTVLALAVALELTLDETRDLLERAGFALSRSSKSDLVVAWFIAQGNYDIFAINEALYSYDQPIL